MEWSSTCLTKYEENSLIELLVQFFIKMWSSFDFVGRGRGKYLSWLKLRGKFLSQIIARFCHHISQQQLIHTVIILPSICRPTSYQYKTKNNTKQIQTKNTTTTAPARKQQLRRCSLHSFTAPVSTTVPSEPYPHYHHVLDPPTGQQWPN